MKDNKIIIEVTESDLMVLEAALIRSDSIAFGRPDQFQFYQNELNKEIAKFLLRSWRISKLKSEEDND